MLVGGAVAVLRPCVVSCQSGQDTAASSPVTFPSSSGQRIPRPARGRALSGAGDPDVSRVLGELPSWKGSRFLCTASVLSFPFLCGVQMRFS